MRHQSGFTVIEAIITIALLTIAAVVALPNLLVAKLDANEAATIRALHHVAAAQNQLRASAQIDLDGDGAGEYGFFRELSGTTGVRTTADASQRGELLAPALLSDAFRDGGIGGYDRPVANGYMLHMYLPDADGTGTETQAEHFGPGATILPQGVDADQAERVWCAIAVPTLYGTSGNRSFFVNQEGVIVAKDDSEWHSSWCAGQAIVGEHRSETIVGDLAIGTIGRDGQFWSRVE